MVAVKSPKFKARFKQIEINMAAWEKRFADVMSREIKRAAIVWLNATVLLIIPVWSGASRATFLKLARAVSFPLTITGIQARSGENLRAQGPSVGFQQSEGKLNLDRLKSGIATFTYETSLFHLVFNEYNNANDNPEAGRLFARLKEPGPYNFQKIGQDAFEDYARDAVVLPSPFKSLKFKSLRVG